MLNINSELSMFKFDSRYQKILRLYGSPAIYYKFETGKLVVDLDPDGDGVFVDVIDIGFSIENSDFNFSINDDGNFSNFQIKVLRDCDQVLVNFMKEVLVSPSDIDPEFNKGLVVEFIAEHGVCVRCGLYNWGINGELVSHMNVFREGDGYIYLHSGPRIREFISEFHITSNGATCKLNKDSRLVFFDYKMPDVFVTLLNNLISTSIVMN